MKFFLLVVLLCCFLDGVAQLKVPVRLIPSPAAEKIELPFTNIEVIDARFDRSNIGAFWFSKEKSSGIAKYEIRFPDSLKDYLPKVIEPLVKFHESTDDVLVIFVKRFRLSEHAKSYESKPELILNASFSFFTRKADKYFKLFSVDKLFSSPFEVLKKQKIDDVLAEALATLFQKMLKNKTWATSGTAFKESDIEKGIEQRYNLPILNEETPAPGLYLTFDEFLKNKPSITHAQPEYFKKKLMGYKTTDGKIISAESCWGASDGNNLFISFRDQFWILQKADKGFRFYYSMEDDKKKRDKNAALEELWLPVGYTSDPIVYHINMETGSIFLEDIYGTTPMSKNLK